VRESDGEREAEGLREAEWLRGDEGLWEADEVRAAAGRLRADPDPANVGPEAGSRRAGEPAVCPADRDWPGRDEVAETDDCMKILFRLTELTTKIDCMIPSIAKQVIPLQGVRTLFSSFFQEYYRKFTVLFSV